VISVLYVEIISFGIVSAGPSFDNLHMTKVIQVLAVASSPPESLIADECYELSLTPTSLSGLTLFRRHHKSRLLVTFRLSRALPTMPSAAASCNPILTHTILSLAHPRATFHPATPFLSAHTHQTKNQQNALST
jgi:hypothetical protein